MGLSDPQESVTVTLRLDEWAVIIAALADAAVPLSTKHKINTAIFRSAELTQRALS